MNQQQKQLEIKVIAFYYPHGDTLPYPTGHVDVDKGGHITEAEAFVFETSSYNIPECMSKMC